jgi:hypothetical protein
MVHSVDAKSKKMRKNFILKKCVWSYSQKQNKSNKKSNENMFSFGSQKRNESNKMNKYSSPERILQVKH